MRLNPPSATLVKDVISELGRPREVAMACLSAGILKGRKRSACRNGSL